MAKCGSLGHLGPARATQEEPVSKKKSREVKRGEQIQSNGTWRKVNNLSFKKKKSRTRPKRFLHQKTTI